nr:MAG TPA: hypothetical protein [Caudoviricetes sp.]
MGDLFCTSWGWEQTGNSGSLKIQVKREGQQSPFSFCPFPCIVRGYNRWGSVVIWV